MNNKLLVGSAILLALLIFSLFFIKVPVIAIESDAQTYYIKDKPVTVSWIHSVERTPWYEIYERKEDELILTETYFKAFGAGVPSDYEVIERKDGFVHMKVDRVMSEMNLIISEKVQTTISVEDKKIELYKELDPYSEVTFKVKKLFIWDLFGGEFL